MPADGTLDLASLLRDGARLAGARGDGPRQGGHLPPDLWLGRDALGAGPAAMAGWQRRASTSSPSITAPSATSCACSPRTAAASPWCRRPRAPTTSCATSPTASFSRTARAIRRRPASMPCRRSASSCASGQAALRHLPRPSDAGAARWAAGPARWRSAIAAPTIRSRTSPPARSRSPARITASCVLPRDACRRAPR